jgi:hypothetical protein
MPVIFTNPVFPNQSGASPFNQAYSVQNNFREMIGEVTRWNPNCDPQVAGRLLNNRYRSIIDRRSWYGLKVRGQIVIPQINATGQAVTVMGSNTVTGIGTNWNVTLVGAQFRQAFTNEWQTITAVNATAQTLQLDFPYPGPSATGPFQITQVYITMGGNIKRIIWAVNQQQGWPIRVRTTVEQLNSWDTWRIALGWVRHFATRAPTPDGQFQMEVWPAPYAAQVFPFEAYTQPPNMVADTDAPVAWLRSDIIVMGAVADALVIGGPKKNDYYDATTAMAKEKMFNDEIGKAEMADNDLDQTDVMWDFGDDFNGNNVDGDGTAWGQSHDV